MLKTIRLDWPQTVLASVVIITLGAVYLLVGEESRGAIERGVLAVWAVLAAFLRPWVRRETSL